MSSASFQFSVSRVASLADCMHVSLFFSPRAKWSKQTLITWPQVCASKRGLRIANCGLGIGDPGIQGSRTRGPQTPQSSSSFLMMTSNETLFIRFSCRYSQSVLHLAKRPLHIIDLIFVWLNECLWWPLSFPVFPPPLSSGSVLIFN